MKNINIVYDPQVSGWDPLFLKELSGMSRIVSNKLRFNNSKAISILRFLGGHFMFNVNVGITPTNGYLTGGGSATAVFGTWEAVTDGEFTITIDGTAYDITKIDFSGVTDMDEVAAVIQAAIRAETGNAYETCVWDTDHFVITGRTAVSVTSAVSGGTGTDISGAGVTAFLDAETGQGTVTSGTNKEFGLIQLTKDIKALFFIQGATLVCVTKDEGGNETTTEVAWDDTNFTGEDIKFEIDMTVSHSVKFSANDEQIAYHEIYAPKGMMEIYIDNEDADNMEFSYIEGRGIADIEIPENIRAEKSYTLFESTKLLQAAFTRSATNIITCAGHGFTNGDKIRVTTSGADLPAGLAVDTDYYVVKIDVDKFYLNSSDDENSDNRVGITDAGTGTHTLHLKSKAAEVKDFRHINLGWHTADSANFTVKIQISDQKDVDFEAAASATNRWTYVQDIDNEDGSTVDGDTGISPDSAGTDENKRFAINLDRVLYVCADITSWIAGKLDLRTFGSKAN